MDPQRGMIDRDDVPLEVDNRRDPLDFDEDSDEESGSADSDEMGSVDTTNFTVRSTTERVSPSRLD
jgi:hypothetical protein